MKIRIVSGKGTTILEREVEPSNWAGESFIDYDHKKMKKLSKDKIITYHHGTVSLKNEKFSDYVRTLPKTGFSLVSGKGTSIKRL